MSEIMSFRQTDLALDDKTVADLRDHLNRGNLKEVAEIVAHAFSDETSSSMAIRKIRDRFTKVLRNVRDGQVQLIGEESGDQVMMINIKDFVAVMARLNNAPSFMAALRAEPGYTPYRNTRLAFDERPRSRENIKPRSMQDQTGSASKDSKEDNSWRVA